MIEIKVHKPRCAGRECFQQFSGLVPKKIKGVFLKPRCRYCTGGKRTRQFKERDPKVYVPSWCPLLKTPAIMRIYCYKSRQTEFFRYLMERDNVPYTPGYYEYAMRYEGPTQLTAWELDDWECTGDLSRFIGSPIHAKEIVEIDDGLAPYYFYVKNAYEICCIPFNGEKARQNKLEGADE